jgi:hypothetical protein
MVTQKNKKAAWIIIIILLIICGIKYIAYMEQTAIYNGLYALKLIPRPERFTELYFEQASSLPAETVQGVASTFSFTIHNEEGATTTYPYRVYFQYPSGHQVTLAADTVVLADNASQTIMVSHAFLASNEQGSVIVVLPTIDQTIDFLVPDNNYQ